MSRAIENLTKQIDAWFANNQTPRLECTSTHCERAQECRNPSECTGDGKRWNLHRDDKEIGHD